MYLEDLIRMSTKEEREDMACGKLEVLYARMVQDLSYPCRCPSRGDWGWVS